MRKNKQLGIWMDHANAHTMELVNDAIIENVIASEFTYQEKEFSLSKGEKSMHTKEQHLQLSYYKKLSDVIINFDEVVIFGPTNAKNELLNVINTNPLIKNEIEILNSDKMTANQMHAFVKEYFK